MEPIDCIIVKDAAVAIINESQTTAEVVATFFTKGICVCTVIYVGGDVPYRVIISRHWVHSDEFITDHEVLSIVNAIVWHNGLDNRGWIWKSVIEATQQHIVFDTESVGVAIPCGDDS